nr:polysaccharide biosynthesis/export family protein [Pacificoceanicola onchidii]
MAGCGHAPNPKNIAPVATGGGYQAQYRDPPRRADTAHLVAPRINAEACQGGGGLRAEDGKGGGLIPSALQGERLTRDDLLDVRVGQDETFNAEYVISRDGFLKLPFLPPIKAQGRRTADIERDLSRLLRDGGFYDAEPRISVRLVDMASVNVAVSGAVFEPHAVEVGLRSGSDIDRARQGALGASTEGRNLSTALRAAGGVRPDADLTRIELHRAGHRHVLDVRGVFEGRHAVDIVLLAGDEIVVPTRMCFQDDLMRPGPISPPGVSLYMSNLTQPATGNALSAIGREVREVPYGTRFMQAVVDTNCVGGARASSAHRSAVLFTRDPMTGVSIVIERKIEDQLRRPDRDDYDPYVLPGDSIACYDSRMTNLTEIGRMVGTVVGAGLLLR